MRRAIVRLAWAGALVMATLLLLSEAVLPAAGRFLLESRLGPALGMRLDVARLDVSLAPLAVVLEGIAASAQEAGPLRAVRCERLAARLRASDLVRGRLTFLLVEAAAPALEINLGMESTAGVAYAGVGWPVRIEVLSIGAAEALVSLPDARSIELSLPDVRVQGFAIPGPDATAAWRFDALVVKASQALVPWDAGDPRAITFAGTASDAEAGGTFPLQLGLSSERGGSLALSGRLDLAEARLDGEIVGQEMELAPLLATLAPDLGVREGRIRGRLALAAARTPRGRYAARFRRAPGSRGPDLEIQGLVFQAGDQNPLSGSADRWAAVVDEIRVTGLPSSPRIDARFARLELVRPDVAHVRSVASADRAREETSDAEPGVRVYAADLQIEDGVLALRDTTTSPPLEARWAHINGDADGVTWPQLTLDRFVVEGSGVGGDPVRISGRVSPEESELLVEGRRDSLARYSPYVESRTQIQVVGGMGALRSTVRIQREGIRASGRVVLSSVELKGSQPVLSLGKLGELPLPVLIALLEDTRGDVALDLDLEIGARTPAVDWLSLIGAALKRSLVRSATVPIRVLAAGRKGEEPPAAGGLVGFVPGTARLTDDGRERVATIARLLAESPQLSVVVHGAATEADLTAGRFVEAEPDADSIGDLAERRAHAVAHLLTDAYGVDADRIRIGPQPGAPWPGEPGAVVALAGPTAADALPPVAAPPD